MSDDMSDALENLSRANLSLQKALEWQPKSDIIRSAIIKNFEFNYELSWKALKKLLNFHGITAQTPRQAIAEGFRKHFLDDESSWLRMIADRNLTIYTFDEKLALEMAERIESIYAPLFSKLILVLKCELKKALDTSGIT